jgi:hypothetical protein
MSSLVRFKNKYIFLHIEKTLLPTTYNAGVVVVNSEVLGLNPDQGCQIFLGTKYQNGKNIPNYHELYQMSIQYMYNIRT